MSVRISKYLVLIAGLILVTGCKKHRDIEETRYTWSTEAPLTVPYRIRLQRFEKGNLIRNHSFETGRTFDLDGSKTSFVIDGWQLVGRHIHWVDTRQDSLYKPDEAFSGYRSVKIERKTAYETDEHGEGILSDFIKVIPGNYTLSCFMKLEKVYPATSRLGTRMYDAINLNLLFFDRNKIAITPKQEFPYTDQYINNSLKALSFANFNYIPSFGWGKVIGKSELFPFSDGDIPSDAQYVKIFIGLKGKGTLWVDSVNFSYNDHNFSVNEKMRHYTDTVFPSIQAIIPSPKQYSVMESLVFHSSDSNKEKQPLIVIPANADPLILKAATLIQAAFQESLRGRTGWNDPFVCIAKDTFSLQDTKSKLIMSLGTTKMFTRYRDFLPLKKISQHQQGYFIYSTSNMPNLVFLGGNNPTGIYYAALTLIQMIDKKQPVFHNARIIDYPDIAHRYFAMKYPDGKDYSQQIAFTDELIRYKFNGAFYGNNKSDSVRSSTTLSSQNQLFPLNWDDLFDTGRMPRYRIPADSSLTYSFPVDFTTDENNPVRGGNDLVKYQVQGSPDFPRLLVPPAFNNQLLDNMEYQMSHPVLGSQYKYLYSGCSFFSVNTDDADIERFTGVTGIKPAFMDNSMQMATPWGHYSGSYPYYPGKIRLFNIFEPFGNDAIREHFSKLDTSLFFINKYAESEIDIIRLATAADFLWNCTAYSKNLSLWKVLQSRYGAIVSRELVRYADQYGLMLEMMLKLSENEQASRNLKIGQQILNDLDKQVVAVADVLGQDHRLVKELRYLNKECRKKLGLFSSTAHRIN
jgi:hypothetical protein